MRIYMYPTKESQKRTSLFLEYKLKEEVNELIEAINKNTNIDEEVMDVIQMCSNIIQKYNIDIHKANIKHQHKLLSRGYTFIIGGNE